MRVWTPNQQQWAEYVAAGYSQRLPAGSKVFLGDMRGVAAEPGGDGQDGRLHRGSACGLADATGGGFGADGRASGEPGHAHQCGEVSGLGDAELARLEGHAGDGDNGHEPGRERTHQAGPTTTAGLDCWRDAILIPCGDGKARRIERGLQCLVDGVPFRLADGRSIEGASRTGILKGLGNAIVPQVAAEFVRAWRETA